MNTKRSTIGGFWFFTIMALIPAMVLANAPERREGARPHVVFVTGDEEYRSEETMPMLARILKGHYGFEVTVCYALGEDGTIDPNRLDNIAGLEALREADLMVMNTRFRRLPDEQLRFIVEFAESGKPMAGFRTATHAFRYGGDHSNGHMDNDWPKEVFGQRWIRHHGGANSTQVQLIEERATHPILRGVRPFHARSWLYHTSPLHENAEPLLMGRAVEGAKPGGGFFGEPHPVAWTHTYTGKQGTSRVFFTTLGHPEDFFDELMRKLALNGLFWALGLEEEIPGDGLNAELVGEYRPNEAGFGQKFKQGLRPEDIPLGKDRQ
jgi:uncharacterized protein